METITVTPCQCEACKKLNWVQCPHSDVVNSVGLTRYVLTSTFKK